MRWYNTYLRPHPKGTGVGLEPLRTKAPLIVGSVVHHGLEAWYRSGWKDGTDTGLYLLEPAIESARQYHAARLHEFEDEDEKEKSWILSARLLQEYHEWFGPGGREPDFPTIRVLGDPTGEPLVEREFELEVSPGVIVTVRPDLVVESFGNLAVVEHKTTSASGLGRMLDRMSIGGQGSMELLVLQGLSSSEGIDTVVVNALVKNRGHSKLPPFQRHHTSRTPEELRRFRHQLDRIVERMDSAVEGYEKFVGQGWDHSEAAAYWFDSFPNTTACVGFSRCQFYSPCKMAGHEQALFANNYRPRARTAEERSDSDE